MEGVGRGNKHNRLQDRLWTAMTPSTRTVSMPGHEWPSEGGLVWCCRVKRGITDRQARARCLVQVGDWRIRRLIPRCMHFLRSCHIKEPTVKCQHAGLLRLAGITPFHSREPHPITHVPLLYLLGSFQPLWERGGARECAPASAGLLRTAKPPASSLSLFSIADTYCRFEVAAQMRCIFNLAFPLNAHTTHMAFLRLCSARLMVSLTV